MQQKPIRIKIIRSNRRTIELQIRNGEVIVRAPIRYPEEEIRRFVESKRSWIEKHLAAVEKQKDIASQDGILTAGEIESLAQQALKVIPQRVAYYAPKIGVTYGRITIRLQKTRWGSCSSKGNLNFNCLLMLTPPEVLDSVVVHELCHRKEMNHSRRFYEEIYKVFPDYDKWDRWLKTNGGVLLRRAFAER